MKALLLIGCGSALGGMLRYGAGLFFARYVGGVLSWGTLCVNVLGCLLLGYLTARLSQYTTLPAEYRLALTVGLCGGFTTFSTFAHENYLHIQQGNWHHLIVYIILSFILGVLAIFLGYWLAR
ncbi:MAG: fluoride efflux transporter CrcB [Akkermansia sp.]